MGISVWQLLIVLLIVVLLFGTKKLRSIGKDMGGAVRGFREAMGEAEKGDGDKAEDKPARAAGLEHDGDGAGRAEAKVANEDKEKV